MARLGGKGLSLEAFAGAKAKSQYNPAELNRKRKIYQNAKKVQQYKKLKKNIERQGHPASLDETETVPRQKKAEESGTVSNSSHTEQGGTGGSKRRKGFSSLGKTWNQQEMKRSEAQKAREEKEKQIAEKKLAREQAEQVRKQNRAKMFKKTSKGQPVMRHRVEGILNKFAQS